MDYFRNSVVLRWLALWLIVSIVLTALTIALSNDGRSAIGDTTISLFFGITLLSFPWFLSGAFLAEFINMRKQSSLIKQATYVTVIILLFSGAYLWTMLLMMDL
jgi:hypothetical protein